MHRFKIFTILSLLLTLTFSFKSTGYKSVAKIRKVVIDAGHGGHDPGNLGTKSNHTVEKDVALKVALKLGNYIKTNFKDVEVIYTRDSDKFIQLYERAAIANRNNADCFISIHCNSATAAAHGTETFVMGVHKNDANLNVALKENSSILLEEDYEKNYDGFDPRSPEAYIMFSMYQNAFLNQSLSLASKIENVMATETNRKSRGVKQAGFVVLYQTTMPSVLVEIGFLTNSEEEKFLASSAGQDKVASSLFKAFKSYKEDNEVK